jgi:peptidoglycan hydrolase-like protein with peptidoglycan-binding domain
MEGFIPVLLRLMANPDLLKLIPQVMQAAQTLFPRVPAQQLPDAVNTVMNVEAVKWVQTSLNILRDAKLDVDGLVGTMTRDAVTAYQTARGLDPIDGWPGRQTSDKLRADLLDLRKS